MSKKDFNSLLKSPAEGMKLEASRIESFLGVGSPLFGTKILRVFFKKSLSRPVPVPVRKRKEQKDEDRMKQRSLLFLFSVCIFGDSAN
jgi:hypothetical protein